MSRGRPRQSIATRKMNTFRTGLEAVAQALSSAELVVAHFQALRATCSDEQWDELTEGGPLSDLLSACCDLEYDLER